MREVFLSPILILNTSRCLNPLKKPKPPFKYSVCDIESRDWTEFLTIGYYDGVKFRHFESLEKFFEFLFQEKISHVFAHFGGIFDFLHLLSYLVSSRGIKLYEVKNPIPRGSGLLCFDVLTNDVRGNPVTISFHDSSALLPFGLKKITETFGVKHIKGDWDHSKTTHVTPALLKYLKSDCMGLYESLEKFFETDIIKKAGPKFTIAGQAMQVLRTYINEPIPPCPESLDAFIRRGYAGGRTEIFRPLFQDGTRDLYCYDVNSLYPSVMRDHEFPGRCLGITETPDLNQMGFVEAEVYVPENTYLPLLWVKNPKFMFPTGRFKGVWTTDELRAARDEGVKILRIYHGIHFENAGPIFREFVTDLYNRRLTARTEVEKTVIKLLLNSSYGRFGIQKDKEGLDLDYGQMDVTPHFEIPTDQGPVGFVKSKTRLKTYSHVGIAAYITAFARLKMFKLMKECQDELYYTDTDSIFTTKKLPNSTALGELKLEYKVNEACFLLPKTYVAGKKVAMKGFDKRKIKNFTFDDFAASLEGEMRLKTHNYELDKDGEIVLKEDGTPKIGVKMSRFKTALKHKTFLHKAEESTREISSTYDKREIFRENGKWESKPYNFDETQKPKEKRKCPKRKNLR